MSRMTRIQQFAQSCADNMADVIKLDVSIIDENQMRVSGTGLHRELIGRPVPKGSFFEAILKTGKPGMIFDRHENNEKCCHCIFNQQCRELASIGYPINDGDRTVGVIGFIGFTPEQKTIIERRAKSLYQFLQNFSTLLENKISPDVMNDEGNCRLREQAAGKRAKHTFHSIIGKNHRLQSLISKAKKVVNSPSTVLISGESGTGKEQLAQAIHYEGNRAHQPFVSINCGSIPEHLLESELFGYERGAFTGAKREGKPGKLELANNGTVFLDEIGDMPLPLQAKLLRVLQEKYIERIGGNERIDLNIRVTAATNKNLEDMVEQGKFREDLFYRIHVIPLRLMPLRDRHDDIPALLSFFIEKHSSLLKKNPPTVKPSLEQWLMNYDWPGNIRQLENAVEYMINMNDTGELSYEDLPDDIKEKVVSATPDVKEQPTLAEMISQLEKKVLSQYIPEDASNIDKVSVAKQLDISLSTLYRKLEKYSIQ